MAWSTPATWVAGAVLTAAQLNAQLRDNLNAAFPIGVDGWTSYTPTLTQSATVTKTSTWTKYQRVGRLIVAQVQMTVTGAGTAANVVLAGLPVAAAIPNGVPIGFGSIYDSSANAMFKSIVETNTTTVVAFRPTSTTANDHLGNAVFTAGLAAGDLVNFTVMYESAT